MTAEISATVVQNGKTVKQLGRHFVSPENDES